MSLQLLVRMLQPLAKTLQLLLILQPLVTTLLPLLMTLELLLILQLPVMTLLPLVVMIQRPEAMELQIPQKVLRYSQLMMIR